MTFAGIFLAGVSVAIFKASDFGTDPNSCFVMGVWNLAGIKYSYVYIAINALMLLGVFFLDRHFIGLGTVLNLFFMGIIVEKGMQLFDRTDLGYLLFPGPDYNKAWKGNPLSSGSTHWLRSADSNPGLYLSGTLHSLCSSFMSPYLTRLLLLTSRSIS